MGKICKCGKGSCKCKCRKHKKMHILPVLACITCFQLLAPKAVKKSLPGKALKYSLVLAWGCIAVVGILRMTGVIKKKKKAK